MIGLEHYLIVAAALFVIGIFGLFLNRTIQSLLELHPVFFAQGKADSRSKCFLRGCDTGIEQKFAHTFMVGLSCFLKELLDRAGSADINAF